MITTIQAVYKTKNYHTAFQIINYINKQLFLALLKKNVVVET